MNRLCFWLFRLLGAEPEDDLFDLFPGTGIVSECWHEWCARDRPTQLQLSAQ